MSNESSVSTGDSSRLRQFGLYRSIDARTEEFLRQSKKRQIRQGCACATISTVITVTVVITIVLIYMKNGPSKDSNKIFTKASWIGIINDSLSLPFEENFKKAKLNLDRSTIKLLPLLIEALKQNRFIEKIFDDYSSSSSTYDVKATTEYALEKNIFAHTKTWLKNPTSRFIAIAYKTEPLVYFKKPSAKLSYISKLRKIRDYRKNLFQYGDRGPVSDRYKSGTAKPPKLMPNSLQNNKTRAIKTSPQSPHKKIEQNSKQSCNCPTIELGILLSKLISSLQNFLPSNVPVVSYKENIMSTTETTRPYTTNRLTKNELVKKIKTSPFHMSEFANVFQKQGPKDLTDKNTIFNDSSTMSSSNHVVSKEDVVPELSVSNSIKSHAKMTDVKLNTDLVGLSVPRFDTKSESVFYTENLKLNGSTTNTNNENDLIKLRDRKGEASSLEPIVNVISNLDMHSKELFKSKVLPTDRHLNRDEQLSSYNNMPDHISLMDEHNEISSHYNQVLQAEEDNFHSPSVFQEIYGYETSTESSIYYQETRKLDLNPNTHVFNTPVGAKTHQNSSKNYTDIIKEYDAANKATSNYYRDEYHDKPIESISVSFFNNTEVSSDLQLKKQNGDIWNFLNSNYDRSKMKSMIPLDRPTYLEVERHSWKNEENEDYDMNLKYNVFDLL